MKTASRLKLAATVASVVRASSRPGAPALSERVQAVPRLVRATRSGAYAGTTLRRLGLVAAAVAYVASPVDLVPEAVLPVVGAADDAVVVAWAVRAFVEETDRYLAWERGQGLWAGSPGGSASPAGPGSPDVGRGPWAHGGAGLARLPEGMRRAATDYAMETVRRRLER
ncbi:DUF1232 domain-containing protein [Terrabacter sp. NPDC000476]|uniref:DUF1232 domain-containing protein n=1 Tax=Terrabacter sp. NPDC000476 TaxID=3154258 RepID=UPI00332DDB3A